MQSVMQCMSMFCQRGVHTEDIEVDGNELMISTGSTQTDIVAVHTPQMESIPGVPFPYQRIFPSTRPSSLPISQSRPTCSRNPPAPTEPDAPQELKQFATSLVDGVLRTVAEQGGETGSSPDDLISVKDKDEEADDSKDTTENGCITVIETGGDSCDTTGYEENLNSAFEDAREGPSGNTDDTEENVENKPCVIISTQPPSTPGSPFEQLDSPNNNQHPIH